MTTHCYIRWESERFYKHSSFGQFCLSIIFTWLPALQSLKKVRLKHLDAYPCIPCEKVTRHSFHFLGVTSLSQKNSCVGRYTGYSQDTSKGAPRISPGYSQQRTSQDIPRVPPRIFPGYSQGTPRIFPGYSQGTPRIFPGYSQDIPRILLDEELVAVDPRNRWTCPGVSGLGNFYLFFWCGDQCCFWHCCSSTSQNGWDYNFSSRVRWWLTAISGALQEVFYLSVVGR